MKLIGQDDAVRKFLEALSHGRLGHAYLLAGPGGVGKSQAARLFARTLLCDDPSTLRQAQGSGALSSSTGLGVRQLADCGRCPSCRHFDRGMSDRFEELSFQADKRTIGVPEVRELQRRLGLSVPGFRRRVVVVDPADAVTLQAWNALLKTVEEPPSGTIFFLVTSSPEGIPATVLSRCQVLRFRRLSAGDVGQILHEDGGVSAEEAAELGDLSDGSAGRALRWKAVRGLDEIRWLREALFDSERAPEAFAEAVTARATEGSANPSASLRVKKTSSVRDAVLAELEFSIVVVERAIRASVNPGPADGGARWPAGTPAWPVLWRGSLVALVQGLERLLAAHEQVESYANPKLALFAACLDLKGALSR